MRTKGAKNKDASGARDKIVHCRATSTTKIYITFISSNTQYKSDADVVEQAVKLMYDQISAQPVKQPTLALAKKVFQDITIAEKKKSLFKKKLQLPLPEEKKVRFKVGDNIICKERAEQNRGELVKKFKDGSFIVARDAKRKNCFTARPEEMIKRVWIYGSPGHWKDEEDEITIAELQRLRAGTPMYIIKQSRKKSKPTKNLPKKKEPRLPAGLAHIESLQRFTYQGEHNERHVFTDSTGVSKFCDTILHKKKYYPAYQCTYRQYLDQKFTKDKTYFGIPAGHASVNIYIVK